jgi:hypothetical protein
MFVLVNPPQLGNSCGEKTALAILFSPISDNFDEYL